MSKADLYSIGCTLLCACIAYFVGGPIAAVIAGLAGIVFIVLAHARKTEEGPEPLLGSILKLPETSDFHARGTFVPAGKEMGTAPRLFLEYSNAIADSCALTFSGLVLKNDGGRAFNIKFQPETRGGMTLHLDNPTQSLNTGEEYPVPLHFCKIEKDGTLRPQGGMLSGQIRFLFERLGTEGEGDSFAVTVEYSDYHRRPFVSRSRLHYDIWTGAISCERG